jgi:thioredoxin-like negative regulator of GroEL
VRDERVLGDEQDATTQALWRQVQALVDARRGQHTQAEQLAREAVAITERTDALNWQGDALCDLAQVLHAAGQSDEAAAALAHALERYQQKQNLAMAAQVRDRMAELQNAAPH